ncbi:hypothetical protein [Brevundimonas sp. Root1423]|uniref:hypothetical protein n=1 Tax=Brevundimonas sp. Root1423 TaxID=1736462 RepID=UPI0006F2A3C3|nr:hypothetical protein [Brevundimonas sp. Root1423]KQY84974.1 hypothetical protein ASD25_08190 [Brevundimonas sp. Root1423]
MRILILTPALLLFAVSGCAPTTGPSNYDTEMRRLSETCAAQGGVLSPTRYQTGRPQTENVCKITGGASRLPRGDQPR